MHQNASLSAYPARLVVAGGGTAGWMAAAALARFLPPGSTIRLVESEAIGTVGVGEATIPQIRMFNAGLGIDEDDFLRATQGTIKLGIEFDGWRVAGERYLHAFGTIGRPLGLIGFHHYWLRARALGVAGRLGDYALNERAAYAGAFRRVDSAGEGPVPPMPYAFHFDAALYAAYLRRYAEARGVVRVEGRIVACDRAESGDLSALLLDGGRRVEGDFFLDCTGFGARLIGQELAVGRVDWSDLLPCDRALAVASAPMERVPPYTRARAHSAGWQWRIPLRHRTGNGIVYSSAHLSDDEAAARLIAGLDTPADGDPRALRFVAGKREAFWERNCVAVGLSSGFLEPLESTSIHLIQSAIARLLQLLPGTGDSAARRDEYNRLAHVEMDRIRDFLVLHYAANERVGEPMWDGCRAAALPDELARKLRLWRESGVVSRRDDELFAEPGWVQVLLGQGVTPSGWHPLADQLSERDLGVFLAAAATVARRAGEAMPSHDQFLARLDARVAELTP